MLEIFNYNR